MLKNKQVPPDEDAIAKPDATSEEGLNYILWAIAILAIFVVLHFCKVINLYPK